MTTTHTFRARIERKQDDLPRYVVLPAATVKRMGVTARVTVEGSVGGVPFGRRSVQPWGDGRFFLTVSQADCTKGGFDTGDTVAFDVHVVSDELPEELARRALTRLAARPSLTVAGGLSRAVRGVAG